MCSSLNYYRWAILYDNVLLYYLHFFSSDHYDSSQKRRVPSWTDRILFKANFNTQLLSYCSAPHIKSSDHRPVYATFKSKISFGDGTKEYLTPAWEIQRETKSEVCCVSWLVFMIAICGWIFFFLMFSSIKCNNDNQLSRRILLYRRGTNNDNGGRALYLKRWCVQ